MAYTIFFLIILVLAPLAYAIVQFNGLISLRNHIAESWSDIDTELKRRYELIPNLVATVKAYAGHEQDVLEKVTVLRTECRTDHGSPRQQSAHETLLVDALRQLLVVAEAYPTLKADEGFRRLHQELVITENRIQAARRFYNGNVRDYRNKREAFPSSLVATAFSFPNLDFFEVEPAVREVPSVSGLSDHI